MKRLDEMKAEISAQSVATVEAAIDNIENDIKNAYKSGMLTVTFTGESLGLNYRELCALKDKLGELGYPSEIYKYNNSIEIAFEEDYFFF